MSRVGFVDAFEGVFEDLKKSWPIYESFEDAGGVIAKDSAFHQLSGPQEEFNIQRLIRPMYGKQSINSSTIGAPPDFVGLESERERTQHQDRKSTRLNSSHVRISYA